MKVFIVHKPAIIFPLEAPAGKAWVLGRTLGANRIGEIRPDEPAAVSGGTVVPLNPDKTSG